MMPRRYHIYTRLERVTQVDTWDEALAEARRLAAVLILDTGAGIGEPFCFFADGSPCAPVEVANDTPA